MKNVFFKLLVIVMIAAFVFGAAGAKAQTDSTGSANTEQTQSKNDSNDSTDKKTDESKPTESATAKKTDDAKTQTNDKTDDKATVDEKSTDDKTTDADAKTTDEDKKGTDEDKTNGVAKQDKTDDTEKKDIPEYPAPYTMAWLDKYAPASVAPFEEQVGDNGDYSEDIKRPANDTYELVVDYTNQCVYAFSKDKDGERKLERVMMCTTGGNGNWTPEGDYNLGEDYKRFGYFTSFNCYAQYWTQMWRSFYFHSLLYKTRDASSYTMSSYNNLGTPGSHGCIRLLVPDARWIYENCAPGTECTVTTAYKKNPALKNALRNGYKGATDYVPTGDESEKEN